MISQIKKMTKKGRNNRRSSLILTRAHEMLTNPDAAEDDNVETTKRKGGWGVLNTPGVLSSFFAPFVVAVAFVLAVRCCSGFRQIPPPLQPAPSLT